MGIAYFKMVLNAYVLINFILYNFPLKCVVCCWFIIYRSIILYIVLGACYLNASLRSVFPNVNVRFLAIYHGFI